MNGDFTRLTFRPDKHYSGVRLQQGRLLLDADWNEQVDIDNYHDQLAIADTVGRCGGPLDQAGFALRPAPGNPSQWSGILGAGRYYVDGILCENEFETLFADQPDLIGATLPSTSGTYLAYLDVWQRHVSALEHPDLLEVALGGPDTTTRTRTVWQAKLERVGDTSAVISSATFNAAWAPANTDSTGRLRARAEPTADATSACLVPPGAGFRRLENQLYRVEIHTPAPGDPATTPATFKWSRENGCVVTQLLRVQVVARQGGQDTLLTVADAGRDATRGFAAGNWVELIDEARVLANKPGIMVLLSGVSGNRLTISNWPAGLDRPDDDQLPFEQWQVRRWDSLNGTDTVRTGTPDAPVFIDLEDGVQVEFSGGTYRTGDYWLIPARTSTGDVDWPSVGDQPVFQERHGIDHQYAPLALLRTDGTTWTMVSDLRSLFPATTDLITLTYAGGGGQQALANPAGGLRPLAQPLQARVVNGQWPVAGAVVSFKISSPDAAGPVGGSLTAGSSTGAEVRVTTGADGLASCFWTLDEDERHHTQRVVGCLVENGTQRSHVAFDAQINRASLVAYTPSACVALSGVRTVQDALDRLCQTGSGREPSIHVMKVALQSGSDLANDADMGVADVAGGVSIQCAFDAGAGQALNTVSITRATCYVALELPYPLSPPERAMWNLTSGALGFERIVLDGQVTISNASIVWQPTSATATWLRSTLFGLVTSTTGIDRLLARLTLKGNFISSLPTATTPASYLDGEVFGSSGRDRTAMVLPSGDGHRGGDFEMWFWLVQNAGLANVAITQGTVVGGATTRVTITLTGPAPAAGTTIQVFVDGDPTGSIKVPASVNVPSGGTTAAFDVTTQPVGSTVNASIRVVLTTGTRSESRAVSLTVQSPVVDTLTLNPAALDSGSLSQATLALTGQAPAGGLSVRLVSSDPNAAAFPDVPSGTVVVPAGQNSLAVSVSTNPAIGNVTVTISATPAAPDKPAQSNLTIRRLTLTGPTFVPGQVLGGFASVGTLTLSGVAPTGGSTIDLAPPPRVALMDGSGNPLTSVVVGAGNRTATFSAVPEGALAPAALPVNATLRVGGATSSGTLFVAATTVSSVGLASNNVTGGAVVNGQVTLSGPAPREGAVVNLSCNPGVVSFRNAAGALVGSIVVAPNTNNAAFAVATQVLGQGSTQTVTIFANIPAQPAATTVLTVRGPTKSVTKDNKDNKDGKDSSDGGGGKLIHEQIVPSLPRITPRVVNPAIVEPVAPAGQAFIQPAERPDVGAATVEQAQASAPEPEPPPPTPAAEQPPKKSTRARRSRKQSG